MDSLFTKIVKGEIPCHKIYEDDLTLAFLDIHPIQPGHTLVIPKKQVVYVWDLDDITYKALMDTTKKVAIQIRMITRKPYVGEQIKGIDIPHAHIHLIPFSTIDEFRKEPNIDEEVDHPTLQEMAARLAF